MEENHKGDGEAPDIFKTVVRDGDDARTVWTKIHGLFTDNKLQRVVFLRGVLRHFLALSLDAYCLRLKAIAGELSYLRLEDRRLANQRACAPHTALAAGLGQGTPAGQTGFSFPPRLAAPFVAPPPQQQGQQGRRRRGRGNGRNTGGYGGGGPLPAWQPAPPPWSSGFNPCTRVVHAYTMPVPRLPAPGLLGPCPQAHQAHFASPSTPAPAYGGLPSYAPPQQEGWDPALVAALQQAHTVAPYVVGGDWIMDTGASSHMASYPDDYSHFVWTFPLRHKSDVSTTLSVFYTYVSTQFGRPIHALQTDNGKELDNTAVRHLLSSHGAIFRLTCPYTSQQNGHVERVLCTLNDCVRTLLFHAHVPPTFWPDALATTTLLINLHAGPADRRPCWPDRLTAGQPRPAGPPPLPADPPAGRPASCPARPAPPPARPPARSKQRPCRLARPPARPDRRPLLASCPVQPEPLPARPVPWLAP
ncbi:hypothetical protein QYE76_053564 [Lolium multiflorum]|uniref:Integrase catalytic domain-containing protein n=1 Tax=Lolium multiflorum TaxID=4521 RepID=A0AAD8SWW5_LOLMU|nr:hypothetical protein QYE76_053564 [Lolium multiflorum]